jgi:LacI family transcriptional regulator
LVKTITMAQIAKAANVSQGAISSLLNDRDYGIRVSEKTRERVFKVCREMGYIPNDLRAVVRMYPELGDYCLLLAATIDGGLRDPFVHRLAAAAMAAVPDISHPLCFATYDETHDYSSSASLPHPIRTGTCSKFLLHGPPNASLLEAITHRGLPVVSLGGDAPLPLVTSLVPDYAQAAELAIGHLAKLGHQHIGIISGSFGSTQPRIIELNRGVGRAYEKLGLPIEAQNIVYGDLSEQAGQSALEELLEHPLAPTAIFAMSDTAALAALAASHARGLRVPGDLSIVGCSDDLGAATAFPALTTIHLPAEEMAERGIREIDRLIMEGVPEAPRRTVLPVRLVNRASTGPQA